MRKFIFKLSYQHGLVLNLIFLKPHLSWTYSQPRSDLKWAISSENKSNKVCASEVNNHFYNRKCFLWDSVYSYFTHTSKDFSITWFQSPEEQLINDEKRTHLTTGREGTASSPTTGWKMFSKDVQAQCYSLG